MISSQLFDPTPLPLALPMFCHIPQPNITDVQFYSTQFLFGTTFHQEESKINALSTNDFLFFSFALLSFKIPPKAQLPSDVYQAMLAYACINHTFVC